MKTLLRIDASARTKDSYSRGLANQVETNWCMHNPGGKVVCRDLAKTAIPHIDKNTIEGFHTPPEHLTTTLHNATAPSNELITELKQADELLIASPLYNLGVPSVLKAYIDQVVRPGHTFSTGNDGTHVGLLKGKTAYLVVVKGGSYEGTPYEKHNFQEAYLAAILQYMGVGVKVVFSLEGTSNPKALQTNMPKVQQQINLFFQPQTQLS